MRNISFIDNDFVTVSGCGNERAGTSGCAHVCTNISCILAHVDPALAKQVHASGNRVRLATDDAGAAGSLEKGIIYVQPSYHYTNTLQLDLASLRKDLDRIVSAGFVNVGLRTSWGEIMSRWDPKTRSATWNEASCDKLASIAAECAKRKLRLIFNTHLRDTVPQGVEGAELVNHSGVPDALGVAPAPYYRSTFWDHMVRDSYKEPMLLFHEKFAKCLRQSPGVPRFWKHAFESAYYFPQQKSNAEIAKEAPTAISKFQRWAQDTEPSISHWAERWAEPNLSTFSEITLPHHANHTMSKAKLGDYWRFWLLGVLRDGKYGLSIGEIYSSLAAGSGAAYSPQLAFKHWKPGNFERLTDMTMDELKAAYDLPINATALGYYVMDGASLQAEPAAFTQYIQDVKAVAPKDLPIIDWETGAPTNNMTEEQQAEWASKMMATSVKEGLTGVR